MATNAEDLGRKLAALAGRLSALGTKLAEAARDLERLGTLPAAGLLEEVSAARADFLQLRGDTLEAARALGISTPTTPAAGVAELEPLVKAVADAAATAARRAALETARKRALAVLDRVLGISHVDDPKFGALAQCQAKAREAREALADPATLESQDAERLAEVTPGFGALLTLLEARDSLDDERFAELEDTVAETFGRALAVAATRGKLALADAVAPRASRRPAAEAPPRSGSAAPAAPPPPPVPVPPLPPSLVPTPPSDPPPVVIPALASVQSSAVSAATLAETQAQAEREAARVVAQSARDDESAQWWVSAWARWTSWRTSLSFSDAVREEIKKYSYLLSVPIQSSSEYEDGLLAYGYSLLLDHVERHTPGFVMKALNSLKTFAPGPQARSVGAHLYNVLVTDGRVADAYPEFVKSVLVAAVPEPGLWTQARILESTAETRLFTHPSARIGDAGHNAQRLTQDRQRFTDHKFPSVLPPLTARFFAIAADVKESRSIEVRLTEGKSDSDHGWLLTIPPVGRADLKPDVHRLPAAGMALPGLGQEYATLWVGVFNSDAGAERRYELTLTLKRDGKGKA